jgi:hypothetical protein
VWRGHGSNPRTFPPPGVVEHGSADLGYAVGRLAAGKCGTTSSRTAHRAIHFMEASLDRVTLLRYAESPWNLSPERQFEVARSRIRENPDTLKSHVAEFVRIRTGYAGLPKIHDFGSEAGAWPDLVARAQQTGQEPLSLFRSGVKPQILCSPRPLMVPKAEHASRRSILDSPRARSTKTIGSSPKRALICCSLSSNSSKMA